MNANIEQKVKELLAAVRANRDGESIYFRLTANAHGDAISYEIEERTDRSHEVFSDAMRYTGPRNIDGVTLQRTDG